MVHSRYKRGTAYLALVTFCALSLTGTGIPLPSAHADPRNTYLAPRPFSARSAAALADQINFWISALRRRLADKTPLAAPEQSRIAHGLAAFLVAVEGTSLEDGLSQKWVAELDRLAQDPALVGSSEIVPYQDPVTTVSSGDGVSNDWDVAWTYELKRGLTSPSVYMLEIKDLLNTPGVRNGILSRKNVSADHVVEVKIKHHEDAYSDSSSGGAPDFYWYIWIVTFVLDSGRQVQTAFKIHVPDTNSEIRARLRNNVHAYRRANAAYLRTVPRLLSWGSSDDLTFHVVDFAPVSYGVNDGRLLAEETVHLWSVSGDSPANRFIPTDLNPGGIHFYQREGRTDMQFLSFDDLLMAPTRAEVIQQLLKAQSIGGDIHTVIEGVIRALGPYGGRIFLMDSLEEFNPQDPNRQAIADFLRAPSGLNDIPLHTVDQAWMTFEHLVGRRLFRDIRWPEEMSRSRVKYTIQGAVSTIAAVAVQDDAPFGDPSELQDYFFRRFGVRTVVVGGGRSRRFSKDPFNPKVLARVDGKNTVIKHALEAARINAPAYQDRVQDVVVLSYNSLYHLLTERLISFDQRQELIRTVRTQLASLFDEAEIPGETRPAITEHVLNTLAQGLRSTATGRRGDLRWTFTELDRRLQEVPELVRNENTREALVDETAYLVFNELLESQDAISADKQADLVGANVMIVLSPIRGPGWAYYEALKTLDERGILAQTRYTMPVYADYAPAALDRYPSTYMVGYLTLLDQLSWRYQAQPRFRWPELVGDPDLKELPLALMATKSPLDEKGVRGRGQVIMGETDFGPIPVQSREWATLSEEERAHFIAQEEKSRRTVVEGSLNGGADHAFSHHVNGGVFFFESEWALRMYETEILKRAFYAHSTIDGNRREYGYTDLVRLAHAETRDVWKNREDVPPRTKTVALGEHAPSGVGDEQGLARYRSAYRSMIHRRLEDLGVRLGLGTEVVVYSDAGNFNPDRDLERLFGAEGIHLQGRVLIEAGTILGDGVRVENSELGLESGGPAATQLHGEAIVRDSVISNSWVAGTVLDSTITDTVVAPGEIIEGALPEKRLERLARIVQDPQRFVAGIARLSERNDEDREGLLRFMTQEILGMFNDKIKLKGRREEAERTLRRMLNHAAASQLTNEELYRFAFVTMRHFTGRDVFSEDKTSPGRDAVRDFAAGLIEEAQTVDVSDPQAVQTLLSRLTLYATWANFLDHQSNTAREVFSQPGFFDHFNRNLQQAVSSEPGIDGRREWEALALDTEEPGTFVFLADNVEEAEVDAALWVLLARMGHRVVIGAKSGPARGDATEADVRQILSAHEIFADLERGGRITLIGTGSETYGTLLDRASDELIEALTDPHLRAVISKGQGNLYTTVVRNALNVPVVVLALSKGVDAGRVTGVTDPERRVAIPVIAVVPAGRHIFDPAPGRPGEFAGNLKQLVGEERELEKIARASDNYQALLQTFGSQDRADRAIRAWMRRSHLNFRQVVLGRFHEETLKRFLQNDPEGYVRRQRELERYDALIFGGGSASQTNNEVAQDRLLVDDLEHTVSVTTAYDNGGRTHLLYRILFEFFGHTVAMGDISAAFKGMFSRDVQDRLLEPTHRSIWANSGFWGGEFTGPSGAFSRSPTQPVDPTFTARLQWLLTNFARSNDRLLRTPDFVRLAVELINLTRIADEAFIGPDPSQPRVHSVDLPSIRHVIFNAVMVGVNAYNAERKTIDRSRYQTGLYLLERAFGLPHRILVNSLDDLELYAELEGPAGDVIWDSTQGVERPETPRTEELEHITRRGEVVINISSPAAEQHEKIRYKTFGYIDRRRADEGEIVQVAPEPDPGVLQAIRQAKPGALVVFGPSSFMVSLLSTMTPAYSEALAARPDLATALLINLTRNNETLGWTSEDYLDAWERHTGIQPKYLVVNNERPSAQAVAEARWVAEEIGSPQVPDYAGALENFDELPQVTQALKRLAVSGLHDAKHDLVLALAFADHGASIETLKERGGVPPLTGEELERLSAKGIVVIRENLVTTTGWKFTPVAGREIRYGAFHKKKKLAEVYRRIIHLHRSQVARGDGLVDTGRIETPSSDAVLAEINQTLGTLGAGSVEQNLREPVRLFSLHENPSASRLRLLESATRHERSFRILMGPGAYDRLEEALSRFSGFVDHYQLGDGLRLQDLFQIVVLTTGEEEAAQALANGQIETAVDMSGLMKAGTLDLPGLDRRLKDRLGFGIAGFDEMVLSADSGIAVDTLPLIQQGLSLTIIDTRGVTLSTSLDATHSQRLENLLRLGEYM